ncbi:MAG: hypothetical protein KDA21_00090 [Phycisphaerales bacterium]|nr:hypothetical protein [Phycisphaerales bacterium]
MPHPRDPHTRLLDAALRQCHPLIAEWTDSARLRENLAGAIADDLLRHTESTFADTVHEALAIPGRVPEDYRQRWLEIEGEVIIADIAFLNRDVERPFVNVTHRTMSIADDATRDAIRDLVMREFACFRPQRVSMWQPSHLPYQFAGCDADMRLFAAPLRIIRAADAPGLGRVRLRPAADLSWYDRYEAEYALMREARPNVKDVAIVESRESMASLHQGRTVHEILIDGEWSGIYAAVPDTVFGGISGILVNEILLTEAARGQSLGPAIHITWARGATDQPDDACLMGTIGATNRASSRAARGAGRENVGGTWWVG